MNKDYIAPVTGFNPSRASSSIHAGGLLEPVPVPPPWGAHTSRSITRAGCAAALLRFVSIVPHMFATCASRGFYIKLGSVRIRSPFPVPRSAYCVTFDGFVPFLRLLRPRKTLARSYPPFPASLRYTASNTAIPRPRRCCFSPPVAGASAAAATAASCTASMNFQLQSYG